jgi:hypothetical protein
MQAENSITRKRHTAMYYMTDWSAYRHLYDCAVKHDKIAAADIRLLYRLSEFIYYDLPDILKNFDEHDVNDVFSYISSILNDYSILTRIFTYDLSIFPWLKNDIVRTIFYTLQKGKFAIINKLYSEFAKQHIQNIFPLRMTHDEGEFFRKGLRNAEIYLEFGSGGSTVAAVTNPHITSIYSVESDRTWIKRLLDADLVASAVDEKRLAFIHADIGPIQNWGNPVTEEAQLHIANYKNYFWSAWELLPANPDVVLIDGRFRVACAIMAALMIKNQKCLYYIHDYPRTYTILEQFFDIKKSVESLSLFTRKKNFDFRAGLLELHKYIFNPE